MITLSDQQSIKDFTSTFKPADQNARANVNGEMVLISKAEFLVSENIWNIWIKTK